LGLWRKISSIIRTNRSSYEETLTRSLIKDIRWRIKTVERQQKSLSNREDKLRNKLGNEDEDDCKILTEYEEENKNLGEHLGILKKKLEIAKAELEGIVSHITNAPDSDIKKESDLKS
jgi:seryl-tRNA synthetase